MGRPAGTDSTLMMNRYHRGDGKDSLLVGHVHIQCRILLSSTFDQSPSGARESRPQVTTYPSPTNVSPFYSCLVTLLMLDVRLRLQL